MNLEMPCSLLMSEKRLYETKRNFFFYKLTPRLRIIRIVFFSNLKSLHVFSLVKIHSKKYNQ